ncbi:MAG: recombinase family protein [bacterium]
MRKAHPTIDEKIAVVYGRVSSDDQAGNASTRGQITEAEGFCRKHELILEHTYFDEAKSGKSVNGRPELERMREDARAGKFQHLVVWKLTRLSRSLIDTLAIIEELDQLGIKFHSITEPDYDTSTSTGRMILRLMATVAEFEREETVENVRMGMKQRAKEGYWSGGKILGYRMADMNIASEVARKGKLIIIPEEAAIVQMIFKLFAEGKGLKSITNHLNKADYRTKNGLFFAPPQIGAILDNPSYLGTIRFRTHDKHAREQEEILVPDAHEPIIDIELWGKVQGLRAIKSHWPRRVSEVGFPLTGVLRCPDCGAGMSMSRTSNKRKDGSKWVRQYYACGRWKNQGTAACHSNMIPAEEVEKVVLRRLKRIVTHPTFLLDMVKRLNDKKRDEVRPLQQRLATIEKMRMQLTKKRRKYIALFDEESIDATLQADIEQIAVELRNIDEEESEIKLRLNDTDTSKTLPYPAVKLILDNFVGQLEKAGTDRQRALLRIVVKEITFVKNKGVGDIHLHLNDSVAKVLGMKNAPSIGAPVQLIA